MSASEFIQTTDPIDILGNYNKLSFEQPPNGDVALAALDKMPETTEEIRINCADLRVLGRKEFKLLLKWRLKVREKFGLPTKATTKQKAELTEEGGEGGEVAEVEPMDEDLKMQEELQALKDKETAKKRRERRKENEKKQKEVVRMQLNMMAPMDIGMEQQGPQGRDALFGLKTVDKSNAAAKIAKGKMALLSEAEAKKDRDSGLGSSGDTDDDSDEEEDRLERELDGLYDQYQERKSAADAKFRAKKARQEHREDEWEGVSGDEQPSSDDEELDEDSSDESDDDADSGPSKKMLTDLDNTPDPAGGLSKRAKNFFNNGMFDGILDPEAEEEEEEDEAMADAGADGEDDSDAELNAIIKAQTLRKKKGKSSDVNAEASLDNEKQRIEVVKADPVDDDDDWEREDKRRSSGKPGELPPAYPDHNIRR